MSEDVLWAILGLALVIIELMTGTFYLLVLGVAAFGAAVVAWLGHGFGVQAVVAAVISVAGCYGVHVYRARNAKGQMAPVDAGQPASFEGWVDEGARRARVRYRGASWEATFEDEAPGSAAESAKPGSPLYVIRTDGNTLKV